MEKKIIVTKLKIEPETKRLGSNFLTIQGTQFIRRFLVYYFWQLDHAATKLLISSVISTSFWLAIPNENGNLSSDFFQTKTGFP